MYVAQEGFHGDQAGYRGGKYIAVHLGMGPLSKCIKYSVPKLVFPTTLLEIRCFINPTKKKKNFFMKPIGLNVRFHQKPFSTKHRFWFCRVYKTHFFSWKHRGEKVCLECTVL